jgi:hypothetical protein
MTRNQIDALKLQEEKRHNIEQEGMNRATIPAQYMSSVGSLARGIGSFFKPSLKGGSKPSHMRQTGMDTFVLY